ncbi:thiol-disulfide isomerase/thioredoxin [Thiogranum longum]|uniref:Thiol-disulfide isomerase/thioredoxin n=1 Tax=Thiogranum longum TaxID=1537524 RepID=A0A4R1H7N8_9GAMM|nr:TlpA disulfide reductase family protein [Thiogranum longum]TCK17844.1 thiol-disulfide isomerase/thioredoxin [Thiogranum longum]
MRALTLTLFLLFSSTLFAEPVDYSLPDLDGKTHSLTDYKGKWVIVNYWATWCPPCLEEIPDLVSFYEKHREQGGDVVVLGVNFEDISQEQLADFVEGQMITYPVLRSEPLASTPLGSVPGLPTTYIIAPDGSPVARQVGPVTGKQLDDYINSKKAKATAK